MNKNINEMLFELIKRQFVKVMQNDVDRYKGYNIVLSNEQQFVKNRDRQANTIFIVVKFLPSSFLFGQYLQNITIEAISEQNGIDVCRTLIQEYGLNYNLKDESSFIDREKYLIKQTYTSPMVASNFNEMFIGYRSLFSMSGTFLVSNKANTYDLYYNGELVECLSNTWDLTITPNTQPYFNGKNFTRSIGQYGTLSINLSTYLLDTPLINKCLEIASKQASIDTPFQLTLKFKSSVEMIETFKLVGFSTQENIGEIPVASLTFTN